MADGDHISLAVQEFKANGWSNDFSWELSRVLQEGKYEPTKLARDLKSLESETGLNVIDELEKHGMASAGSLLSGLHESEIVTDGPGKPTIVNGKINPDGLCVVHATNYLPTINEDGSVDIKSTYQATEGAVARNTVHFTLNHKVKGHGNASWDDTRYSIVAPFNDMVNQNGAPQGLTTVDTYWTTDARNPLHLPDATLVAPAEGDLNDLVSIQGNRALYKTKGFTPLDEAILSAYVDKKVPETATPQEKEALLSQFAQKYATEEVIRQRGYKVEPGGEYSWRRPDFRGDMLQNLAETITPNLSAEERLKSIYAGAHYWSPHMEFELRMHELLKVPNFYEALANDKLLYNLHGQAIIPSKTGGIEVKPTDMITPVDTRWLAQQLDAKTQDVARDFGLRVVDRINKAKGIEAQPQVDIPAAQAPGVSAPVETVVEARVSPAATPETPHAGTPGEASATEGGLAAVGLVLGSMGAIRSYYEGDPAGVFVNGANAIVGGTTLRVITAKALGYGVRPALESSLGHANAVVTVATGIYQVATEKGNFIDEDPDGSHSLGNKGERAAEVVTTTATGLGLAAFGVSAAEVMLPVTAISMTSEKLIENHRAFKELEHLNAAESIPTKYDTTGRTPVAADYKHLLAAMLESSDQIDWSKIEARHDKSGPIKISLDNAPTIHDVASKIGFNNARAGIDVLSKIDLSNPANQAEIDRALDRSIQIQKDAIKNNDSVIPVWVRDDTSSAVEQMTAKEKLAWLIAAKQELKMYGDGFAARQAKAEPPGSDAPTDNAA